MNETDLQAVIGSYQQKAFELFNQNIVYETQINALKKEIANLNQMVLNLQSSNLEKTNTSEDYSNG